MVVTKLRQGLRGSVQAKSMALGAEDWPTIAKSGVILHLTPLRGRLNVVREDHPSPLPASERRSPARLLLHTHTGARSRALLAPNRELRNAIADDQIL